MSIAAISYDSLKDASSRAKTVAKRLTNYANSLDNSVYKKLNNYSGTNTGNIQTAKSKTKAKIDELKEKSKAFTRYADDLSDLKEKCFNTDRTVRSMVAGLTADFKKANGIKNSKVENTINYFLTSFTNSTVAGRWISNKSDEYDSVKEYIKQSLKNWWNYEGGKDFVKGVFEAQIEMLIAQCGIALAVIAIVTTGPSIAAVAGIVGGVIALFNARVNLENEYRAYYETNFNADPALGRRRSNENTLQDTIRRETDSRVLHNLATGIDVTKFVCDVIGILDSVGGVIKKGFKWSSGNTSPLSELKVKDILFSKNNWSQFLGKIKMSVGNGLTNVWNSARLKDYNYFKNCISDIGSDFIKNLKNKFFDFSEEKKGISSIKSIASVVKNHIEKGINFRNIAKNYILPGITITKITTIDKGKTNYQSIVVSDFYNIFDGIKSKIIKNSVFSSDSIIDKEILKVLNTKCDINISIPKIYIPPIDLPVLRFEQSY